MSLAYGRAIESVGWKKRRDIGRVAAVWALRFGKGSDLYRFDLIGVEFEKGAFPQIIHIEDAWRGVEK
jgi:Holliday junction resolvase-like predicted endonuclease